MIYKIIIICLSSILFLIFSCEEQNERSSDIPNSDTLTKQDSHLSDAMNLSGELIDSSSIILFYDETQCLDPWKRSENDEELKINISDFLATLDIKLIDFQILNYPILDPCKACYCKTGRRFKLKVDVNEVENINTLINKGFYRTLYFAIYCYDETSCADPWEEASTNEELKENIINFLSGKQVLVHEIGIRNDGEKELCKACRCETGKRILIRISNSDTAKIQNSFFYKCTY